MAVAWRTSGTVDVHVFSVIKGGAQGFAGAQGIQGIAGATGAAGATGVQGVAGINGRTVTMVCRAYKV